MSSSAQVLCRSLRTATEDTDYLNHSKCFYLKLSQVPNFQKTIVPSWQEEWFTPVPAYNIDVWRVSFIGWEHGVGRGTDVPDTDRLIHWTGCKNLEQTREWDSEVWTLNKSNPDVFPNKELHLFTCCLCSVLEEDRSKRESTNFRHMHMFQTSFVTH